MLTWPRDGIDLQHFPMRHLQAVALISLCLRDR
jgi:hypothetical protein